MSSLFDHEKLDVYQQALSFVDFVEDLLSKIQKRIAACNQLDRASTSIPLNIAEGNGKYTAKDRCRFFDIARGSALECSAVLDVMVRRKVVEEIQADEGKKLLRVIVSMLIGLIRSHNAGRVYEDAGDYGVREVDYDYD